MDYLLVERARQQGLELSSTPAPLGIAAPAASMPTLQSYPYPYSFLCGGMSDDPPSWSFWAFPGGVRSGGCGATPHHRHHQGCYVLSGAIWGSIISPC